MSRSHKITLLSALYLAQGLPFGFFTLALPALLRTSGWSLTALSALSFLYLPWALKFLWSPYVEYLGTRKQWLMTLQVLGVAVALAMTLLDLEDSFMPLLIVAFLFNIIAATQDIVTDGLAVRLLDTRERGLGNGIQVGAYRLGMILGGNVLLILFAQSGWRVTFFGMAAILALTILPVLYLQEPPATRRERPVFTKLSIAWLQRLFMPGMLAFVGLIFCYRLGDQMVTQLLIPFLTDQGLDLKALAIMKGGIGSATALAGAFAGGWFAFVVPRRTAVLIAGLAQAASFGLYIAVALGKGGMPWLWTATVIEAFIGTIATVALFTLMMDASDPEHAGVDYTLFASAIVAINSIGNFVGASIADAIGYAPAFIAGAVIAAVGCLVVVGTLDRRPVPQRVATAWLPREMTSD